MNSKNILRELIISYKKNLNKTSLNFVQSNLQGQDFLSDFTAIDAISFLM